MKALTKKQIFDLQFKWGYCIPNYFELPEIWWESEGWWRDISRLSKLSEDFIREFQDQVSWSYISANQTLSENFIREFQDKVDWFEISCHQILSEDFAREFKDRIHWNNFLPVHQIFSGKFIEEMIEEGYIKDENRSRWSKFKSYFSRKQKKQRKNKET